jgi:hypothetical protein
MNPGLSEMRAETPQGYCLACGDPLVRHSGPGRDPIVCQDEICRTAYQRLWRREYRRAGKDRHCPRLSPG